MQIAPKQWDWTGKKVTRPNAKCASHGKQHENDGREKIGRHGSEDLTYRADGLGRTHDSWPGCCRTLD